MKKTIGLFEGFGVELEYMIVDKNTLRAKPIADELIKEVTGKYTSDYDEENIAWSNELVLHVIELKTNGPVNSLKNLDKEFYSHIKRINKILEKHNAILLPSGAHPFFDPDKETKLWPHENNPVYELYDKIFDCRGHGWSNLQSTHLNLAFADDEEFGKLHSAIRLIIPILPAIAASTPILNGKSTGYLDSRLEVYRKNQIKIPSITGKVIPEQVFTIENYKKNILKKIYKDISPYDKEGILQFEWLNSRGAIPRFDRNTIEIRVIDIQESPKADIAVIGLFILAVKELIEQKYISYKEQQSFSEELLSDIFLKTIQFAENTIIENIDYLKVFGVKNPMKAQELWQHIYSNLITKNSFITIDELKSVETILNKGTLATRIQKVFGKNPKDSEIVSVYEQLSQSLTKNEMFDP